MSDVDALVALLERDPDNAIVAAMLTDELMEARGMLRSEADRHVANVIAVAAEARELAEAAAEVRPGARWRGRILSCVRWVLGLDRRIRFTLLVVPGTEVRLKFPPVNRRPRPNVPRFTVTLGSRLLLDWVRLMDDEANGGAAFAPSAVAYLDVLPTTS